MAITFPFRAGTTTVLERPPAAEPAYAAFDTETPDLASPPPPPGHAFGRLPWHRVTLLSILALSAFLELWQLNKLGTSNTFYAAAVLSMTQNWHAFFFNSLDPAGFVTIDKPPLGFWVQAISARMLGFSGFSILLPEALATIGSVGLLYRLVRRAAGELAGLLAALGLALMPIAVVVGRNNTIDALLVFTLLLATWAGFRAAERGSLTWLLATAVLVGLGFEIKMLQAYLVLPGLGLLYLLGAPLTRRVRAVHLAIAAVALLVVSLAWPVAVDLTPASQRPWIDSTQDNSAVDLALGYNGLDRLVGQGGSLSQFVAQLTGHTSSDTGDDGGTQGPGGAGAAGANGGGMFNNGPVGPFRLFDQELGGQASWLLPLALLGAGLTGWEAWRKRRGLAGSRVGQSAVVWGAWLLAAGGFFSVANFFHSYYLVMLGPPIAALFGIGVATAWRLWQQRSPLGWLLPVSLVATAAAQASMLAAYPGYATWLTPVALGGTALGALLLLGWRLLAGWLPWPRLTSALALGLAVLALLVAPAVWGGQQTLAATSNGLPSAGPASAMGGPGTGGGPGATPPNAVDGRSSGSASRPAADGSDGQDAGAGPQPGGMPRGPGNGGNSAALDAFLLANQGSATYIVAATDSNTAAPIILATGKPVMSLGGFTGSDPILTVQQFAALVQQGAVRFVLGAGQGGPVGPNGGSSSITSWVQASCRTVTLADGTGGGQTTLYDCGAVTSSA